MILKKNKQAFTLVELIVVITILAILWTIAFISLQGYSASVRNTKRISDIQNIKKSLELFTINTWKYPLPDSWQVISYSWDILWTQWIVWENVSTNLSRNLQKKPTDPLLETPYFYSVINLQTQYELLANYEGSDYVNINLLNNTYAANYILKISWNYNQVFVKTSNYIIPIPSIINALNIEMDLKDDLNYIKSQIVTGWENNIANGSIETSTWWLSDFNLTFTWTIDDNSSDAAKISVINAIQSAYSWTSLASNQIISEILLKISDADKKLLAEEVVLNTWVVSSTQIPVVYNDCEAWTITWEIYTGVNYLYNLILNWETWEWNWTEIIEHWTQDYTAQLECNDWELIILSETAWSISCNSWYTEQWWECIAPVITQLIPVMTSNTTPLWEAFISSELNESYTAWKAFDNNSWTWWHTSSTEIAYIWYKFDSAKVVNKYYYKTNNTNHEPTDFQFQWSNDWVNWTVLDEKTNYPESPNYFTIEFDNTDSYLYYRFYCTKAYYNLTDTTPYIAPETFEMYWY